MTTTDVCVIGAGIAGLTTAYRMLSEGLRVVVVDAGAIGGGESLRTTAHLTSAVDRGLARLEDHHGARGARIILESHAYAIDWIEWLCAAANIDCGFERLDGHLFAGPSARPGLLDTELAAAERAGAPVHWIDRPGFGSFAPGPCLRFDLQAQLDPAAYLAALARLVVASGGQIREGTLVERLDAGVDDEEAPHARDASGVRRTTHAGPSVRVQLQQGRPIAARHVVVATHVPICGVNAVTRRQEARRSYVITLEVPRGDVPAGLYWDTEAPQHTLRVVRATGRAGFDTLLVRGEDHRTGQEPDPESCFERLERWALARFPHAARGADRWSAQVMQPADGVGLVGRCPGTHANVYVITGDAGNGIALAALGARILADLVAGRPNPWARVYDPARTMLRAAGPLLRANLNTAMQYLDRVEPAEALLEQEIPEGSGAVVRAGATLLAVYRDDAGAIHACSARCPHRGVNVHWNDVEKSWDCPCHGSRFDAYGARINGPATRDLMTLSSAKPAPVYAPLFPEEAPPSNLPLGGLVSGRASSK